MSLCLKTYLLHVYLTYTLILANEYICKGIMYMCTDRNMFRVLQGAIEAELEGVAHMMLDVATDANKLERTTAVEVGWVMQI